MANLAFAETGVLRDFNWAVDTLTIKAHKSHLEDRLKAIELLAHKTGTDAVMIMGSALADFGSALGSTEKCSLALALADACTVPLAKELAVSFLTRAALGESREEVKAVFRSVLERLD